MKEDDNDGKSDSDRDSFYDSDSDSDYDGPISKPENDTFQPISANITNNKTEMYSKYLFKELCLRVVMIYQDLIKKLASNAFINTKQFTSNIGGRNNAVGGACQCPRALGRAIEECEFLKGVLRIVLPSESILQPSTYSGITSQPNISVIKGFAGKEYPSADQLATMAHIYSMMILR